jgi:hypothetical protein
VGRLDRLQKIVGETAESAGRITDVIADGVKRNSPEYVARLKTLAAKAGGAVEGLKKKVLDKASEALDKAEAEMDAFEARAEASELARRRAQGLAPAAIPVTKGTLTTKRQVAELLACVYWLRTAEAKKSGAAFNTEDIFGEDEELDRLTEAAIRAHEAELSAADVATVEKKLAAAEAAIAAAENKTP